MKSTLSRYLRLALFALSISATPFALAQDGGGAAAPAGGGGGGAAAAAPAAASSAPAGDGGGAAAAAVSTSAADASATSTSTPAEMTPNPGESDSDYLVRVMAEKSKGTGEGEPKPGDPAPTPTEEETPGETEKTEGGEETPAGEAGDEFEFDPFLPQSALLAPKELSDRINGNEELKAALAKDPELQRQLLDQSRSAAEAAEFRQVFANADEAKTAAAAGKEFNALSNLVTAIDGAEGAQAFYHKLLELSVMHDDEGAPIMRDGKPVSDGTVGRLIHHTGDLFLSHFEGVAKQGDGDDELAAAVEILRDRAFGKKGPSTEGMNEQQKEAQTRLDAQQAKLNEERAASAAETKKTYEDAITHGIDTTANSAIDSLLKRSDLADDKKGDVQNKIREAAYAHILTMDSFQIEQDALMRRQSGPKTRDARIALGKRFLQIALPIVAPKIIADEGAKILGKQSASQARQAERVEASRSETAATLRPATAATKVSAADLNNQVTRDLTAKLGRAPNAGEILAGVLEARSAK